MSLVHSVALVAVAAIVSLAIVPCSAEGKKCYNCGYRKMPDGQMASLPNIPECRDFAKPEDITVTCTKDGDCCGSLKEYYTTVDEQTHENSTIIIGRHACETDIKTYSEQDVLCSEHTDECFHIERGTLPDHHDHNVTITDMEVCFCSGDRCNADDPIPPKPTTTGKPGGSTATSLVSSTTWLIVAFFVLS